MKYFFVIALSALLLVAGCQTTPAEDDLVTGAAITTSGQEYVITGIEKAEPPAEVPDPKMYEVWLTDDKGFFPKSFAAEENQPLELTFLFDEPHFITIEGIDFAEHVEKSTLTFTFPKKGTYYMICESCEDPHDAVISIW